MNFGISEIYSRDEDNVSRQERSGIGTRQAACAWLYRRPASTEKKQIKILYVEDSPAHLNLVEKVLSARFPFVTLITAVNGETGLELAQVHYPDLILLDIHLPDIYGYEVLQCLRLNPSTASIPVVAVTADTMPKDIASGLMAGFHHYLTKPINLGKFIEIINTTLQH